MTRSKTASRPIFRSQTTSWETPPRSEHSLSISELRRRSFRLNVLASHEAQPLVSESVLYCPLLVVFCAEECAGQKQRHGFFFSVFTLFLFCLFVLCEVLAFKHVRLHELHPDSMSKPLGRRRRQQQQRRCSVFWVIFLSAWGQQEVFELLPFYLKHLMFEVFIVASFILFQ